jgi:hypothetical protein
LLGGDSETNRARAIEIWQMVRSYFVAEKDPQKTKAIIGAMMAPNEKVEAWGRLPEAAVKALGLKPGDFKHG